MSVTKKEEDNTLTLTLCNGDKDKFQECLRDWNFKDEQSMLRFLLSLMLESKDKKTMGIIPDKSSTTNLVEYSPADHLTKESKE